MRFSGFALASSVSLALLTTTYAAGQKKGSSSEPAAMNAVQPATETLDLDMYARIREEGFRHSHVMEYSSALFDDIGPRLTGSPAMMRANNWTKDQLSAMGL